MADWLTHVFFAYAFFTVASWVVDLPDRWVAVGLVGSVLPDLDRLALIAPANSASAALGVPFDWNGLHTLGGLLLLGGVGALLFERRRDQRRALALLYAGALSHLLVDLPQPYADGLTLTNLYLFPFSSWRTTTPGWYVSADRWVVAVAFTVALVAFLSDRYLVSATDD
jgi:membrane-bound metal-dependent hydrolase YbcI (DUF457 family)